MKRCAAIIFVVRLDNQRINIGTRFRVLPTYWNIKINRVKNVVNTADKDLINVYLNNTEEVIKRTITEMKANQIALSKEAVYDRIDVYLKPTVVPV